MSDNTTTAIAIVGIITGIGSAIALVLKHIKHSKCSSCCEIDTRTPTLAPPPTPILFHKQTNNNITTENKKLDNNNNTTILIEEIEV